MKYPAGAAPAERIVQNVFERKSMDNLFQMWWLVACVVLADVIYQVCAKKISSGTDPLAALGVTYLVSAAVCAGLYYGMGGMDLLADMSHARLARQE